MTELFDEGRDEAVRKLASEFVNAIAGPLQAEDELNTHLDQIFNLVKDHRISETSKIKGEVQLTLTSQQGELHSRVLVDEICLWSPRSATGQPQQVFFVDDYPNFPTEFPLKLIVSLVNCGLPWELVTFRKTLGFQLKIYKDESQQELLPKQFQSDPSPTGQFFWGNGKGKVDQMPLWASYTLPEA